MSTELLDVFGDDLTVVNAACVGNLLAEKFPIFWAALTSSDDHPSASA